LSLNEYQQDGEINKRKTQLYDINLGKRGMKKRRVGEEGGWGDNVIMRGFWP
jgi:hypothetical protein